MQFTPASKQFGLFLTVAVLAVGYWGAPGFAQVSNEPLVEAGPPSPRTVVAQTAPASADVPVAAIVAAALAAGALLAALVTLILVVKTRRSLVDMRDELSRAQGKSARHGESLKAAIEMSQQVRQDISGLRCWLESAEEKDRASLAETASLARTLNERLETQSRQLESIHGELSITLQKLAAVGDMFDSQGADSNDRFEALKQKLDRLITDLSRWRRDLDSRLPAIWYDPEQSPSGRIASLLAHTSSSDRPEPLDPHLRRAVERVRELMAAVGNLDELSPETMADDRQLTTLDHLVYSPLVTGSAAGIANQSQAREFHELRWQAEMCQRETRDYLQQKHGLTLIVVVVDETPFDLDHHEDHPQVAPLRPTRPELHNRIARVIRNGFTLNGRVVRKARVIRYLQEETTARATPQEMSPGVGRTAVVSDPTPAAATGDEQPRAASDTHPGPSQAPQERENPRW